MQQEEKEEENKQGGGANSPTVLDFLGHLESSGKTTASTNYYYAFKKYAADQGKQQIDGLKPGDFKPARLKEHMAKLSSYSSKNMILSAVKGYLQYLKEDAVDDFNRYMSYSMMYDSIKTISAKRRRNFGSNSITVKELRHILDSVWGEDDYHRFLHSAVVCIFFLGARPVELSQPFVEKTMDSEYFRRMQKPGFTPERVIDYDNKLIQIITAKTNDPRIIPIPEKLIPYFREFFWQHDRILEYCRPREWITNHLRKVDIYVTAKTARYTLETLMKERVEKQHLIDMWLGHTTKISDIYTNYIYLIRDLKRSFLSKHYIFEVIEDEGRRQDIQDDS